MDTQTGNWWTAARLRCRTLGVVFLVAGVIASYLAVLVTWSGDLLADYYDARQINWRLPDSWVGIFLLLSLACPCLGFLLHGISGQAASRRTRVVMVLFGVAVIPLFYTIFSHARVKYPTQSCLANQRQLGTAASMYWQDHQGRLPRQLTDLMPYLGDATDVLRCPLERKAFHRNFGYGMNGYLAGKQEADVLNPTLVLWTADSVRPNMRILSMTDIATDRHVSMKTTWHGGESREIEDMSHPRGCVVSYLDGHATFLPGGTTVRFK